MKKRIVIVDDHASIRDMLVCVLKREANYEIVGEAATGLIAMQICATVRPDLVVLDLMLPELCGTEVIRRIRSTLPMIRTLVYSGTFDQELIIEALKCKPHGFVEKSDTLNTLREAISLVASGGSYFTQYASGLLTTALLTPCEESQLTLREREILQLVAEGGTNKGIAGRLGVSNKTIENHRSRLMEKLHLHDVASLTRYAIRHGIVTM